MFNALKITFYQQSERIIKVFFFFFDFFKVFLLLLQFAQLIQLISGPLQFDAMDVKQNFFW